MCQVIVFPGSALLSRAIPLASTPSLRLRKMSTPPVMRTAAVPEDIIRSDIWFSDGNIVLVARGIAFKVHRGQLQRHSEVFRDLFSIPQPSGQNQALIDGCEWVELYDAPSDVLHLLSALYDGL